MAVAVAIVVSQSPSFAKAPFSCDAFDSTSMSVSAAGANDTLTESKKNEDAVPEGLAGSDWNSIRQVYEQNRHAAVAVDAGFRARNPGQQWLTHFDGRGFFVKPDGASWQWGLELQSYGFPGHQRSINGQASMTADNDRVTYDWHDGLQEWFVNDRSGLEHGFTLTSRPTGAGDPQLGASNHLEFRLAVRGGLLANEQADGLGVSFVNGQGSVVVNYAGLKVWDADKRELPARIIADATGLRLTVDERGARYPLTIDPVAQQAYLKASNTDEYDLFGVSVAMSGDTVVVGAPWEDSNATGVNGNQADNSRRDSGAAYVFVRDGDGDWSQQAYLKASYAGSFDQFGRKVAMSGDTVVVGVASEDSFAVDSGAVYVFVRDGGVWSQQAFLKASNIDLKDRFGESVAVSGDTVVVGVAYEDSNDVGVNGNQTDNSAVDSGAAYIFVRDSFDVWSQQAYLKASNTGSFDQFGRSVAISDDTVVVGVAYEDSNAVGVNGNQADNTAFGSGAAYVFVRDRFGVWSQQAYLKASNTDASDFLGWSVSVSGDTVVVGAAHEDSNAVGVNGNQADNTVDGSGAVYVFVRDGGVWSQQAYLKASNTDARDYFGRSVDVCDDTVVIGAWFEDSNATGVNRNDADNSAVNSGAAYVFVRDDANVWSQRAYLKASNTDAGERFGNSAAVSGDTVVIGAYGERSNAMGVNGNQTDSSAFQSGAAYVFHITPIVCGDGVMEGAEQCDDGDTVDDDRCSATCLVESGFACLGEPSVCVPSDGLCGDLDDDLMVDGDDLAVLLAAFGRSLGNPRYNAIADLDDDGTVTLLDYQIWLTCYRVNIAAPFAAAPQPGIPGDLDADWDVDLADLADFEFCQSEPPGFEFSCLMKFDFDGNNQIDLNDYAEFQGLMLGP